MTAVGLVLVLLGAALVAAEAHVPSHGALGSLAVVLLALGVALAVAGAGAATAVAIAAALAVAAAGGAWVYALVKKVLATRRIHVRDNLIGRVGVVRAGVGGDGLTLGQVFVDGALWRARTWGLDEDEKPLAQGDPCVVERVEGLTLTVRPAEEWELI
jgi:membrane-bound ClpP family serine protease